MTVGAYIEQLGTEQLEPTVKQQLAAILDYLSPIPTTKDVSLSRTLEAAPHTLHRHGEALNTRHAMSRQAAAMEGAAGDLENSKYLQV
jgi:hypothetical protein